MPVTNRTIFCRDNLEILRGIDTATIDLIYLDPPFNKNKDFTAPIGSTAEGASFKDIFGTEDIKDEWVGLIADKHPTLHNYLAGIKGAGHKSNKYYLCYMAVRLMECHRILKSTGSLYYHCDPTMSHYIKIMLDCIFGEKNFRNELVWCYTGASEMKRGFPRKHDIILFYTKSTHNTFNYDAIRVPYKHKNEKGAQWADGVHQQHTLGTKCLDWFQDIPSFMTASASKERVGYPTQKPLALLERIVSASSNRGDMVLDPFCGCATTCIAAEKLDRQWIGIDISKKAFDLVRLRLGREIEGHDTLFYENKIAFRDDIPQRTDADYKPNKLTSKHYLFGVQEGRCAGCGTLFEFRHFHLDHIYPQSKGGGNNIDNLQLLCGSCNVIKGNRDMAYLRARLKELKFI